jgi:hypothetical protein
VLSFAATADATIGRRHPRANSGRSRRLRAGARPPESFVMKFAVSGIGDRAVKDAKLQLYVADGSSSGASLSPVSSRWEEARVTWRSAPASARTSGAVRSRGVGTGRSAQFDVSRIVTKDGVYSVRVSSRARTGATYNSREAQHRPQLVVTVAG